MATRFCGLVICVSLMACASVASAADPTLGRGIDPAVAGNGGAAGAAVTILRGTPRQARAEVPSDEPPSQRRSGIASRIVGTGENLWYVDSGGRIRACWLTGTGYVNSLKVVCTR